MVIDHMLLQIRQCIGSLSVVGIDRIKFVGIKEIIVTAAANGNRSVPAHRNLRECP